MRLKAENNELKEKLKQVGAHDHLDNLKESNEVPNTNGTHLDISSDSDDNFPITNENPSNDMTKKIKSRDSSVDSSKNTKPIPKVLTDGS